MYVRNGLLAIIPSTFVMFFYRTHLSHKHVRFLTQKNNIKDYSTRKKDICLIQTSPTFLFLITVHCLTGKSSAWSSRSFYVNELFRTPKRELI